MTINKFVIISAARSKSSYLVNLLNSHPAVVCHSELFHQDKVMASVEKNDTTLPLFEVKWRDHYPQLFLQQLYTATTRQYPEASIIGSKLLLYAYQINRGLDALLRDKPRILFLYRDNYLAWYSSLKIAMQTNVWGVQMKPLPTQTKIKFEEKDYVSLVENQLLLNKYVMKLLKENCHQLMCLEYDMIGALDTNQKILEFLDLPHCELTASSVQQNTGNVLERFSNPEEVYAYTLSTGKGSWLR